MLTTVKGTYQDGVVRLDEPAPLASQSARKVLVVFLEPASVSDARPKGVSQNENMAALLASWEQTRALLTGMTGSSLSDEVLAERREED